MQNLWSCTLESRDLSNSQKIFDSTRVSLYYVNFTKLICQCTIEFSILESGMTHPFSLKSVPLHLHLFTEWSKSHPVLFQEIKRVKRDQVRTNTMSTKDQNQMFLVISQLYFDFILKPT